MLTDLKITLVKLESSLTKLMNTTNTLADNTETSTAVNTNNNISDMKTTIPGNGSDKQTLTNNNTALTKNAGKANKYQIKYRVIFSQA
jgi:hypothetical protein